MSPAEIMASLPAAPAGAVFAPVKVETVVLPHPYCITSKHVAHAADHFCGRLGAEAIKAAERAGARCDICRHEGRHLRYDEHESMLTLFIAVPREYQRDLNACPGLHTYLLSIKARAGELGVQGFAFPVLAGT